MKLPAHIGISSVAAVTAYELAGSPAISLSLFLSGIFIDLDHVVDYLLLSQERFSFARFFAWYEERKWQRIFIVLHSYELLAVIGLAALLGGNDIVIGIATGSGLHLIADQLGNIRWEVRKRLSPWFYFLAFRYAMGFEKKRYWE